MAISDKLTYLNTTKGKIKDAINLTNANILSEDTFRSYAEKLKLGLVDIINNGTDDLYDSFPKTTQTGTEIALNDTYEAPMEIGLNGNTEQNSYSGINLLNTYNVNTTLGDLTITSDENGILTLNGTTTAGNVWLKQNLSFSLNGTYTLIFKKISGEMTATGTVRIRYTLENSSNAGAAVPDGRLISDVFDKNNSIIVTTSTINDTLANFSMYVNPGATFTNYKVAIYLVQGTYTSENIPDYQPYVGGSASPSPSYPQPVKVVTGNNTINVHGKNLFNAQIQAGTYKNATYTVASDGKITQSLTDDSSWAVGLNRRFELSAGTYTISIIGKNSNNIMQLRNITDGVNSVLTQSDNATFTLDGTKTLAFKTYGGTYPVSYYVQLEPNPTATSYAPYQSKDYEINLGDIELCKIGDYQDYIYKENNKWYKHSEIGKVVLDGTENWNGTVNTNYTKFNSNSIINNSNATGRCLSSHFILGTDISGRFKVYNNNWIDIFTIIMTLQEFKTWLSNNNVIIYYACTPTNTEITDTDLIEQLEELKKAKSVDDKTFISQINEQLPFILDVSALSKN